MRKKLYKIGMIFCVMNFIGIAVALFLAANLGSDSIGLLCDGLHRVLFLENGHPLIAANDLVLIVDDDDVEVAVFVQGLLQSKAGKRKRSRF